VGTTAFILASLPRAVAVPLLIVASAGLLVLIVLLQMRIMIAIPAMVLEGGPVRRALARGWALVRGSSLRFFGVTMLASIVASALAWAVSFPVILITALSGNGAVAEVGDLVATVLATVIGQVVATGSFTLLYIDQRIRRENLAPVLAAAAAGGSPQ
jgi:membrane-anchored glycerophosphoryl diester phosphodiesterase (GDPDase)